MNIFAEQVARGKYLSSAVIELLARGIYLMNGGDPRGWDRMTNDEIQLIYTTYTALEKAKVREIMEGLVAIIKAMG